MLMARPNQGHSLGTLAGELTATEGPCRSGERGGTSGIFPSPAPAAASDRSTPQSRVPSGLCSPPPAATCPPAPLAPAF